jgi:hypothetical protein
VDGWVWYQNANGETLKTERVTGPDARLTAERLARDHNRREDAAGRPWGHPDRLDAVHG